MNLTLTPDAYDGIVSALTGNGVLCTTVCPTGYHAPPEEVDDQSQLTQHFVMAGRRRRGAQHPLINFGTLSRSVRIGKNPPTIQDWKQTLDVDHGVVVSEWKYEGLEETTRSCVLLEHNVFLEDTVILNSSEREITFTLSVCYAFGENGVQWSYDREDVGYVFDYTLAGS